MRAKPDHNRPPQGGSASNEIKVKPEANKEAVRAVAAHRALVILLAGAEDARALARLAIPMTETDFLNLCEERALAGKCGNPLCTNPHAYKAPSHTPKIDWATLAMVTVTIEQHWCSNECHAKCAQFAKSLGNAIDRLQVLNRLQAPTSATHKVPPVVSHVKGGQKPGAANQPPSILSDVHERVPATASSPACAATHTPTSAAQPRASPAPHAPNACIDPPAAPFHPASTSEPESSPKEAGSAPPHTTEALEAAPQQSAQGGVQPAPPGGNQSENGAALSSEASKTACGAAKKRGGGAAFCKALLRDVKRSEQVQAGEADVQPDDFFDEDQDSGVVDCSSRAQQDSADAQSSQVCMDGIASLRIHDPRSTEECAPVSAGCSGADCSATVNSDDEGVVCEARGALGAGGGARADVQVYSAVNSQLPGCSTAGQKPYSTVKNKFKPVRPCPPSDVVQEPAHGDAAQEVTTDATVSPPRTPSGEVESPAGSRKSLPRPLSNGSKKRVLFGTCQMFAYDPEAPPADSGDRGMCEVPLPPAPPEEQHTIASSTLSPAPPLRTGTGTGTAHAPASASASANTDKDCSQLPLKTGPATQSGEGPEAGAIPVLCFDVHQGASENEMEGALRVTTADALELSEADLDAMHQSLEERYATAEERFDGGGGHGSSSGGAGGRGEEEGPARAPPQRRPRLRRRGRSLAPPVQRGLGPEAQHDLQRQAVADMFRYYLAPEVGGAGVAVKAAQLHDVAASLEAKRHKAAPRQSAAARGGQQAGAREKQANDSQSPAGTNNRGSEGDSDECSSDGAGSQSDEGRHVGEGEWCDSDDGSGSCGSDGEAEGDSGDSDVEAAEDDAQDKTQRDARGGVPIDGEEQPQSVEGFFDARAVSRPRLSLFGVVWKLLNGWVCPAAVLHLHARPPAPAGVPQATQQAQGVLRRVLMPRVAGLLEQLHVEVARPVVEGAMYDLINTLHVTSALPTMAGGLQDCLALVLLAALSKHCVAELACSFSNENPQLKGLLQELSLSPELFDCLIGCLLDPVHEGPEGHAAVAVGLQHEEWQQDA